MDPEERLEAAYAAARQGRHEEALAEYIWFHEHALEIEPALYGVRLSFALVYWLELAQEYPPARTALEAIRDRKVQALLTGDANRSLFHDAASINEYLCDVARTASVFEELAAAQPAVAAKCVDIALPALVACGRFDVAARHVPDPFRWMETACDNLNEDVAGIADEPPSEAPMLEAFVWIYTQRVAQLIAVLNGIGQAAQAESLRNAAIDRVSAPSARSSVREALASS